MAQAFARQFQYNIDIIPDRLSLTKVEKKPSESFRKYGFRWREQAARVNPPMEEDEMVKYFFQALEPTYYGHLISAIGKSSNDVVKIGEMVEEGLKSSKIMSYSAIKATTQAIQSGTESLLGKKKKEDVAMVVSGSWHGQRGHDIEKCWHLKTAIQELIDTNQIVVQSPDAPNINQNPLPTHAETHMIEIVHKDGEPKKSSKSVMMIRASESNLVKAPDSTKAKPLIVEGVTKKPSSKPPVLVVKGLSKDIGASLESSKVVVPGILSKPVIFVKGAPTTPIIIKLVTQLPVVDAKAVPWNYKQVIVTYKGKEIEEEVNETGGLTRSDAVMEAGISLMQIGRVLVDNGSSANICPLSTLQKLKIGTKRIHLNSVCVRGFDGGDKDSVGDVMLELSIGPVEFTMEFQVLDVVVSYNLLLGRPWIHTAKAVPSSLHQIVKFEWDTQEIVVHGDEDLSACNDTIVPFIEANDDKGPWVYQTFETVSIEKIPEGKCIPGPKLSSASVMVANEMLKNDFVPGKYLGSSLQGIVYPVRPSGNPGTFGLGFMPTKKDVKRVKNLKQKVWSLLKPVPHISKSFVKPGAENPPTSSIPKPVVDVDEELIKRFQSLFEEVNMVKVGEGSSKANVQLVGPNVKLSNWEATPLPTRKEFW
ncbi:uncharacterized protein [Nicotiana sylvestris]|uniref:uncharacterized protein n=1 Tax=Nicotiana sylvestris TaxID=4096 RepID=UPI00388C8379